ncbi:MAG: thioesterase family protein [Synergistes sp.]|nr:thioesterase family protein [Synergistes sp.]
MNNDFMLAAEIRVRYSETDRMGIVYNANYLDWFEVARTELCRNWGTEYRKWENRGLILPVVEAYCRYKASAKYDDKIELWVRVTEIKYHSIKFEYKIVRKEDSKVLAMGYTRHGCTNASSGKLFKERHPFYEWVLSKIQN